MTFTPLSEALDLWSSYCLSTWPGPREVVRAQWFALREKLVRAQATPETAADIATLLSQVDAMTAKSEIVALPPDDPFNKAMMSMFKKHRHHLGVDGAEMCAAVSSRIGY